MYPLNQSYATLVYGDGEYACAAAVLARVLRELDEHRPITFVAHNVSSATVRLLSAEGSRVVQGPPLRHVMRGRVTVTGSAAAGELVLAESTRKMLLWSLPFDKVLFLDADHHPTVRVRDTAHRASLALRRAALSRVWSLDGELAAAHLPQRANVSDGAHGGNLFSCAPTPPNLG